MMGVVHARTQKDEHPQVTEIDPTPRIVITKDGFMLSPSKGKEIRLSKVEREALLTLQTLLDRVG